VSTGPKSVELPNGDQVPYSVQRREVDNPRLTLNPDGTLAVVVPPNIRGDRIVASERDWIESQYESQQSQLASLLQRYDDLLGSFTLWGRSYDLQVKTGNYEISVDGSEISIVTPEEESYLRYLQRKLRDALKTAVRTLAAKFCSEVGRSYETLTVRSQRTKWASCSSGDTLNFNLRCAFLPIPHLRYLVAHEVAHLVEQSHSDEFWQVVQSLVPGYEREKSELQGFWYAVHHNPLWVDLLD